MRNAFLAALTEIALADERVCLLSANCGWGVLDGFAKAVGTMPNGRFLDVGIAEQNMIALAAGLATTGRKVIAYSISNFPSLRALEQIRNLVLYPRLDVKIVSVGAGFVYGAQGMTHHMTEDAGVLRALPEMEIFTPADPLEAEAVARIVCAHERAAFVRLQRAGESALHAALGQSEREMIANGTPIVIGEGAGEAGVGGATVAIVASGAIVGEAYKAQTLLAANGVKTSVYSAPRLPLNARAVAEIAKLSFAIITLEEHNRVGALGSAVAEILCGHGLSARLLRLGLDDTFATTVGDADYLRVAYGLNAASIAEAVMKFTQETGN
ncbi:transketolase [Campylobacterota bacterium]|nr:transketolase [Campylobacterota bacterium]